MTKLVALVAAVAATVGGSALAAQPPSRAEPAASKIVDRTISCTVGLTGGIHKVELTANTGTLVTGKPSVWKLLANVNVEDLGTRSQASVSAGNPLASPGPNFPPQPERLWFSSPPSCKQATRIRFSRNGLTRTTVDSLPQAFGSGINCYPGKRVLLRVRGMFSAPTSLHASRYPNQPALFAASGTIAVGYLAVRSASGKPLAYAEVFQNGKAKLFIARSCDR